LSGVEDVRRKGTPEGRRGPKKMWEKNVPVLTN